MLFIESALCVHIHHVDHGSVESLRTPKIIVEPFVSCYSVGLTGLTLKLIETHVCTRAY
jgi:hypothetical protein